MYEVWIPIMNRAYSPLQAEKLIKELRRARPQLVLIVYNRVLWDRSAKKEEHEKFIRNKEMLENAGFQVGAWLAPTVGYGDYADYFADHHAPYRHLIALNGREISAAYCPLDERFLDDMRDIAGRIAGTGIRYLLLEDDFTLSGGKMLGGAECLSCCCEKHLEEYQKRIGKAVKREELFDLIIKNKDKRYREVWLTLQGETLKKLAAAFEKAAHEKNPELRIGLSANSSSYNIEGVSFRELAKIVAGKNRPFARLTGAPYWDNMPLLATSIEAIRLQTVWCGAEMDLITEGDTYPRPRSIIPSSWLEEYDMILRADAKSTGILKYMIDYNANADYETGYVDRHIRNRKNYREIARRFTSGINKGLYLYEQPDTFAHAEFNKDFPLERFGERSYLPLVSQWFANENSVPTTYENTGDAALIFGESARHVPKDILKNGAILDAHAAKLLMQRGIDVGIEAALPAEAPVMEHFPDQRENVLVTTEKDPAFYAFTLSAKAKVLSEFYNLGKSLGVIEDTDISKYPHFPACYLYENKEKMRFMIYSFTARTVPVYLRGISGVFRSYCRQRQLADGVKWLQLGRKLPAMCYKNPQLYILCKKNGDTMTVGLWNLFADEVIEPVIYLDEPYQSIDFYNCRGNLSGDKVKLSCDLPPHGFCCFTVKK